MLQFTNEKNVVYRFCQWICQLFVANLLFILGNLFLVFNLLFLPNKLSNLSWLSVSMILAGPTVTGLFAVVLKGIEAECQIIHPVAIFFRTYRKKFWRSLGVFSVDLFVCYVFFFNVMNSQMMTIANILAIGSISLLLVLSTPFQFVILATFETNFIGVFLNAILLAFRNIKITVVNLAIMGLLVMIANWLPGSIFFVLYFSFLTWALLQNMKPVVDSVKKEIYS